MPRKFTPAEIDHALELRSAGKSFAQIARELGRSDGGVVRQAFKFRGIETAANHSYSPPNKKPPPGDLAQRYAAGESVLAMANRYGVARNVVTRWLDDVGLPVRTASEAMKIRMAKLSPPERSALAEAAHAAVRGSTRTDAACQRVALTKERVQYGGTPSPGESALCKWLSEQSIEHERQRAVGRYNIDVVIPAANIAVEILGGNWHASKPIHAIRTPYLLSQGWHVLFIWDQRRFPLGRGAYDYLVTYAKETSGNPTAMRQYRVIRGDGQLLHSGSADDDQFPVVAPTVSTLYRR